MTQSPVPHRHGFGLVRREFLQVGFSGFMGLSLPTLLAASEQAPSKAARRAKSVIIVFLTGGPSHLDTFDMKPDAPDGIRSEFKAVETKVPGIHFCEHLPSLATHADKLAVVRSMSHEHTNHLNATHQILTGHPQPNAIFDKIASRDDYPCYASGLEYVHPRRDGVPSGVMLPTFLVEGPLTWPGQHAGMLGPKFDPWQIRDDPNKPHFKVESLALPAGFSVERLHRRRTLGDELGTLRDQWSAHAEKDPFADQQATAYNVLLSGKVSEAFKIQYEDPKVRDRYGRHVYGQSLLLARRLVQAGVPIVQVNMGHVQTWDSHGDIFNRLKRDLLPPTDKGVSALLDDLATLGMLDETLVVISGEFGRTPKLSKTAGARVPGRDHWSKVFTTAFAGGGVRGGQIIGQSDKIGAFPATRPYSPLDLGATIYQALGVDLDVEVRDRLNRPIRLVQGEPIEALFTGGIG
jgi:hypothetical protein